jgi:two-component system CheB/CheR fusion protein
MAEGPPSPEKERAAKRRAQAEDVNRENLQLRREAEALRQRTVEITSRLLTTRSGLADKRLRLAALNLMEDAEEARRRTSVEAEERKRAERSLHASEERLRAALTAGKMGTWDWDPATDRLVGSETLSEVLGLRAGQLLSTFEDRLSLIHPDDLAGYRAAVEGSAKTGGGWHREFRIVRPRDGRIACVEERAHASTDPVSGNVLLSGVVWDVSERKRAEDALRQNEARLRLILESAVEYAIFSLDYQRRVTMWSRGAERLLGYSQGEILGQSADEIFTAEDRARGAPQQETDTALEKGRAADERWHVRKSGERFWGSGVLMAMRGPMGQLFGFVKILRDHTEAKRHEDAMAAVMLQLENALVEAQRAREEAENANRAKDTFLAALSHELRTPLTPVLLTAESLLRRKDLPSRVRDGLEVICRNVELETHFINDLLDLTRIARGKFEIAREPVNVHDALRAAVEVCHPDLAGKKQQLTLGLEAREKITLGDFPRLQQVFWNLLKNASKFTPERGQVRVSTSIEENQIVVTITDTGIGIDPGSLVDIFEAFRQGDCTIAQKYGGLGLGLAISRATVIALGGSITAESVGLGHGSSFTVRLPLAQTDDEERH